MWEWLTDHHWVGWLVAAAVLFGLEVASLDLVLSSLAFGALGGAVASALGAPFVVCLAIAIAIATFLIALVRPPLVRRLHAGPTLATGHEALVGRTGLAITPVDEYGGQVRLAGETWTARSYDPAQVIEAGAKVVVAAIDGATAVVTTAETESGGEERR